MPQYKSIHKARTSHHLDLYSHRQLLKLEIHLKDLVISGSRLDCGRRDWCFSTICAHSYSVDYSANDGCFEHYNSGVFRAWNG